MRTIDFQKPASRYETDLGKNKPWKPRSEDLHIQERGSDEIRSKGMFGGGVQLGSPGKP